MPIPLAHPAAILPLRRYCPRYLSFAVLIIGSIAPDTAYLIDDLNDFPKTMIYFFGSAAKGLEGAYWDDLSHDSLGSVLYCLPVGFLMYAIFQYFRNGLVATLPNPHRNALLPLCQGPTPKFLTIAISLLIGVWLHIAWDSITNDERWLASQWEILNWPVVSIENTPVKLCRIIWALSSIGGPLVLAIFYWRFLRSQKYAPQAGMSELKYYILWITVFVLPILLAIPLTLHFTSLDGTMAGYYSFTHRFIGMYISAFCGCLLILCTATKTRMLGQLSV